MSIGDIIVIGVLVLILGSAMVKIVKDKKRGVKCSGCDACCDKSCEC